MVYRQLLIGLHVSQVKQLHHLLPRHVAVQDVHDLRARGVVYSGSNEAIPAARRANSTGQARGVTAHLDEVFELQERLPVTGDVEHLTHMSHHCSPHPPRSTTSIFPAARRRTAAFLSPRMMVPPLSFSNCSTTLLTAAASNQFLITYSLTPAADCLSYLENVSCLSCSDKLFCFAASASTTLSPVKLIRRFL